MLSRHLWIRHSWIRRFGIAALLALLAGCASHSTPGEASPADESLIGNYWKLMTLRGESVAVADNQREAHLVLNQQGRVSGSTGCNRLMGGFSQQGDTLTFSGLGSTRMACPQAMMTLEQAWLAALGETAHYAISGQRLVLKDADDQPLAELKVNALY